MKRFLTAVIISVFLVGTVEAFCIYNKTDKKIKVTQFFYDRFDPGFSETISSSYHKCCHWKNSKCNPDGKEDSPVYFVVTTDSDTICENFKIEADQSFVVIGKNGSYRCIKD